MSLIFSPLTEDALEGPYQPIPKGVFLMVQLGEGISLLETKMDTAICETLKRRRFKPVKASTRRGHKDYLEKIIQIIRGCGFGTAIFSEYTPAPTLANIFFEVALCNLLGKPVIIVKTEGAKAPSDFVRTEWVAYKDGKDSKLRQDYSESLAAIVKLGKYYETLGDLALDAVDVDLELAFERYRQAALITSSSAAKRNINTILATLRDADNPSASLRPARVRLQNAVNEFCRLLP